MRVSSVMLLPLLVSTVCGSLQQIIEDSEKAVSLLAASAKAEVNNRWESLDKGTCNTCSIPACGTEFPEDSFECKEEYGFNKNACTCPGVIKSVKKSTVRFSSTTLKTNDPEVPAFVCASEGVTSTFVKNMQNPSVGVATQLVGHKTGVTRVFPGFAQDRTEKECGNYDPRIRPWYVTAASGPKDIVMVLDISGSMNAEFSSFGGAKSTRMEAVKVAAKGVVDTLTSNDFISIIVFNEGSQSYQGKLIKATPRNVADLKEYIDRLQPAGSTKYSTALKDAFKELKVAAQGESTSSGCTRMIQFLSDGENDRKDESISDLLTNLQKDFATALSLPTDSKPVRMFTYSMTEVSDSNVHELPKRMACENDGIWSPVRPGLPPFEQMTSYFLFLAAGISDEQVRWTNPYEDAFGRGQMVTAAMPIYEDQSRGKVLAGVVGVDVPMETLLKYNDNELAVLNELTARGKQCPDVQLSFCDLQQLRANHVPESKCPVTDGTVCTAPSNDKKPSSTKSVNDLLCQKLDDKGLALGDDRTKSFGDLHCCPGCKKDSASNHSTTTAFSLLLLLFTVFIAL